MSFHHSERTSGKRADIQILRAYAVIVVVLYHSGLGLLSQGFIGVDVFFVISGYLITGHIRRDMKAEVFSLTKFYAKRMRRLLPAAYMTFAVCLAVAPFVLSGTEGRDFCKQVFGAVGFFANYILKNQTGYFEGAADLKPLLHTWSLSVEEQFYFLIPPLLLIIPYRLHGGFIFLITLLSYLGCWYAKANPETIFYTLPYRSWELGLGALANFRGMPKHFSSKERVGLLILAIASLIVIPFISQFHGQKILLISFASLSAYLIILFGGSLNRNNIITRFFVSIGDISYSWYLVHWPIFSFYNNMVIGSVAHDREIRLSLLISSAIIALLLNRWIENRLLNSGWSNKSVFIFSFTAGTALIGVSLAYLDFNARSVESEKFRERNPGFSHHCSRIGALDMASCRNSESPKYMVWGDSMAMQLVDGLVYSKTPNVGIVQATRHSCVPLLGVSGPGELGDSDLKWAKTCLEFNDEVIATLRRDPSIKTVVLSGNLITLLKPNRMIVYRNDEGVLIMEKSNPDRIYQAIEKAVTALRGEGMRVVFVLSPPSASYDVGRCIARLHNKKPLWGANDECAIEEAEYKARRSERLDGLITQLRNHLNLSVIGFDDALCHSGRCMTVMDGIPLYRDDVHFTIEGGRHLIQKTGLLDQIDQSSR